MRKLNAFTLLLWLALALALPARMSAQTEFAEFQAAVTAGGIGADRGNAVLTFGGGDTSPIYVAGDFTDQIAFGGTLLTSVGEMDGFVIKYNRDGTVAWVVQIMGERDETATALAADPQGNIYVTGTFRSTGLILGANSYPNANNDGSSDVFLAKINPAGTVLWVKTGGGAEDDIAGGVAVDKFGQVYLTGGFRDVADFDLLSATSFGGLDAFLARYDGAGNLIWLEASGGFRDDQARDVVVDAVGTVFIGGSFESDKAFFAFLEVDNSENIGTADIFIASYDSLSLPLWVQGGGGTGYEAINAMALDTLMNEIYITGAFDNTAIFGSTTLFNQVARGRASFVAKLDDAGNYFWAKQSQGSLVVPTDIALDTVNNVLISGYFGANAEFDCTTLVEAYTDVDSIGNATDAFFAKYSTNGDLMAALRGGAADFADEGRGVYVDDSGHVFMTGFFSDTARYSQLELQTLGLSDAFLAAIETRISECGIPSAAGMIYGDTTAVCVSDTANLASHITTSGFTGEVIAWQYSYDNGQTWETIETFDNVLETTQLTVDTTWYRAVIQNCTCPPDTTAPFRKITNSPTVAGQIKGPSAVCAFLPNNITINVEGGKGYIKTWEVSFDNFSTPTIQRIPNFDPSVFSLNYANLTQQEPFYRTYFFRAVMVNGACDSALTAIHAVKLDSCLACSPIVTKGGRVIGDRDTVCSFGDVGSVQLVDNVGDIVGWEVSTDNFSTITFFPPPSPPNVFQFFNVQQTTWMRARVRKLGCSFEVSEPFKLVVDSCEACGFPATDPGRITGAGTVCFINNAGRLTLEGNTGDVVRWEISYSSFRRPEDITPDNTVWLPVFNSNTTLDYNRLIRATWYRAVVRSFGCREAYTAPVLVNLKNCVACVAPAPPVISNITDFEMSVSWERRATALDYELQYRRAGDPFFFSVPNLTNADAPYILTNLEPGVLYEVRVRTRCAEDNVSGFSLIASARTSCTVGGATYVDLNDHCAGNNFFELSLAGSSGRVVYWESSTDDFKTIQIIESTGRSLAMSNVSLTTSYRAFVQDGDCPPARSLPVTVRIEPCNEPCPQPAVLVVSNVNPVSAFVLWLPLSDPAARYELSYRAIQSASWITIQDIVPSNFQLTGLAPNTNYEIRLRNVCADGTYSDYSAVELFATPPSAIFCQTPVITNTELEVTTATLTWGAIDGALGYQLRYRRASGAQSWTTLNLTQNFVTLRNLLPNVRYRFQIRSWCGDKYSFWSGDQFFTTKPYPCYTPTGLAVQPQTSTTAVATWSPAPHAASYVLRLTNLFTSQTQTFTAPTTTFTFTNLQPSGVYSVEVRSNCGEDVLSGFSPAIVFQSAVNRESGATSSFTSEVRVYPNPNEGRFTIELPSTLGPETARISVTDLTGRSVYERTAQTATEPQTLEIDLVDTAAGVYLLTVEAGGQKAVSRIIVR